MPAPTVPNTSQLTEDDFTAQDVAEFHRLMTELLTACGDIADRHASNGMWEPSSTGLFGQFSESMTVIADVSRALNQTRRGIHTIGGRARQRSYNRTHRPARHPQPD